MAQDNVAYSVSPSGDQIQRSIELGGEVKALSRGRVPRIKECVRNKQRR
jgi:hypothetical protein